MNEACKTNEDNSSMKDGCFADSSATDNLIGHSPASKLTNLTTGSDSSKAEFGRILPMKSKKDSATFKSTFKSTLSSSEICRGESDLNISEVLPKISKFSNLLKTPKSSDFSLDGCDVPDATAQSGQSSNSASSLKGDSSSQNLSIATPAVGSDENSKNATSFSISLSDDGDSDDNDDLHVTFERRLDKINVTTPATFNLENLTKFCPESKSSLIDSVDFDKSNNFDEDDNAEASFDEHQAACDLSVSDNISIVSMVSSNTSSDNLNDISLDLDQPDVPSGNSVANLNDPAFVGDLNTPDATGD